MIEKRRVLAVLDHDPSDRGATLEVTAWLDAEGGPKHSPLRQEFPTKGKVFASLPLISNLHPGDYIVLDVELRERHNQHNHWQSTNVVARPFVIVQAPEVNGPLDLSYFIREWKNRDSIRGREYLVEASGGHLFGPFVEASNSGGLKPKANGPVNLWRTASVFKYLVPGSSQCIAVPIGNPHVEVLVDPSEALKRLLRLGKEAEGLAWLSRDKLNLLVSSLAKVSDSEPCSWIMGHAEAALGRVFEAPAEANALLDEIRHHPVVANSLKQFQEDIAKQEREAARLEIAHREAALKAKEAEAVALEAQIAGMQERAAILAQEERELSQAVEVRKNAAATSFNNEVRRLAEDPSALLILRSLLGSEQTTPYQTQSAISFASRIKKEASGPANPLRAALANNLRQAGFNNSDAISACVAGAIHAGQPIFLKGNFSSMLLEAIVETLARPQIVSAEVSAGLLSSVRWPELEVDSTLIVENLNLSVPHLVLGSLLPSLVKKISSGHRGAFDLICTCTEDPFFPSTDSLLPGPIIDLSRQSLRRPRRTATWISEEAIDSNGIEAGKSLDVLSREDAEKWGEELLATCRGPLFLALQNAAASITAQLGAEEDLSAEEILIAWWLAPRTTDFDSSLLPERIRNRVQKLVYPDVTS